MDKEQICEKFLRIYPEFKPVLETDEQKESFYAQIEKVKCLYPEFKDLNACGCSLPFLAHFIALNDNYSITQSYTFIPTGAAKAPHYLFCPRYYYVIALRRILC